MKLSKYIDHTLLAPTATENDIRKLCSEAVEHQFFAVCVHGAYTALCNSLLENSKVKIATVVGFPLGANATAVKAKETELALKDGADEIDMVLNIGFLKSGDFSKVAEEIRTLKSITGHHLLKVILETCYLTNSELLQVIDCAREGGADYIKTSTGFGTGGATEEAVKLMLSRAGTMKVKASGGIRNYETAKKYIDLGVSRIGTSSGISIITHNINKQ